MVYMDPDDIERHFSCVRNFACWKSRPDPLVEQDDELHRERLWLGLECDVAVVRQGRGRDKAPPKPRDDRRYEGHMREVTHERYVRERRKLRKGTT